MAIRKFRKNMKPVVWIITIFFLITLVAGYVMSFTGNKKQENIAFDVNGKKVEGYEAERTINNFIENYGNYLGPNADKDLVSQLAFNELINKYLTLEIAKQLKVKVPGNEIDEQYNSIEKSFPDAEQFKRALAAQGYTRSTFKKEIEENLLIEKTLEDLKANTKLTPEDIKENYIANEYTLYSGKTLEEATPEIENNLKQEKGLKEYFLLLSKAREKMKLEGVSEEYKQYLETTAFEKDGFKVTNLDMAKRTLGNLLMTNGDKEKAEEMTKTSIENQIKIANIAKEKGVLVDESFPLDYKLAEYQKGLYEKLKSDVKVTDEDLKKYFDDNKMVYDTFPAATADIAVVKVEPSDEDKLAAKTKAEELIKKITPKNFAEIAKKNSQGPSAPNGGDLGTFSKGDMVQPFEDAVFKGKVGEVYPEPVETVFGQHIIYVQERDDEAGTAKASHILIVPEASKKTVEERDTNIKDMIEKLQKGEITFDDLSKEKGVLFSKKIEGISDSGYIPGLGYNEKLTKDIFDSPIGEIKSDKLEGNYFIFKKLSEVKYKEGVFEELKNRVEFDYKNSVVQEELKKLGEVTEEQ
ncbi:MAG: peptidylprolyl isomerase [Cetobacterium sp.]